MRTNNLENFAHSLLGLNKNETEKAVAYMWFKIYHGEDTTFSVSNIASELNDIGLITSTINKTRLSSNLKKHELVTFSKTFHTFTLPAVSMKQLNEEFEILLKAKKITVEGKFISPSIFENTRGYLIEIAHEINGCYEYNFFDGAAVLLRRLVEGLVIEIFIHHNHESIIKKPDNSYLMLNDLMGLISSGKYFRLSRGSDKILLAVKEAGDTAAHNRYHITKDTELDWLKNNVGKLLSELLHKSGIK